MRENRPEDTLCTVHEAGVQYVVNAEGQKLGVLLSIAEYERLLSVLEEKKDVQSGLHPTRLVPAERLNNLTGLVPVGGDALADSEALYDPDWD